MASSYPEHSSPDARAEQIWRHFNEVADLAPEARRARLEQLGRDDPALRREVESLLEAHTHADDVLGAYEHLLLPQQALDQFVQQLDEAVRAGAEHVPHSPAAYPGHAPADPLHLLGQTAAHYRVEAFLGGGGMGLVYRAHDTRLGRSVALKFLPPHLSLDEEAKARFVHEAKAASALDHVNIGTVHDIGETDPGSGPGQAGRLFIAMAYYAGETLKARIAQGPLPVEEAVGYAIQMAEGLARAHEAGIIHRDVKPANVMVTERGRVKLVDFGLAKVQDVSLTQTGTTLGTVAYMSPEQASGAPVDVRTDLWSLGVVLYEMLAAERPYRGAYPDAVLYSIRHEEPEPVRALRPEVPEALARVVEKLLQKKPAERYQQAEALLADLRTIQQRRAPDGADAPAPRVAAPRKDRRATRRMAAAAALAALVALAWAGGRLLFEQAAPLEAAALLPAAPIESIAVLPLENLSGDAGQDHIADGMTEALIENLGQIEALHRVISYTSVRPYKDAPKPLPEIGRALAVPVVVEGSMRLDGEMVHIAVRLIEAETEVRRWSEAFVRPLKEVVTLQREIARAIAAALEVALRPEEERRLTAAREVDPAAMNLYLLGLQAWHQEQAGEHKVAEARDYFEQAIAADSNFAKPYAALPVIYAMMEGAAGKPKAERYALKALELDPMLSEAHVAQGIMHMYSWEWAAAEASHRKAIALNPNNSEAHRHLGLTLVWTAQFEEGLAAHRRALELAPLSPTTRFWLRSGYYFARQYEQLIEDARPDSNYYWMGMGYLHQDRFAEAREAFETCCEGDTLLLAYYYATSGQRAAGLKLMQEIEGTSKAVMAKEREEGENLHRRWGLAFFTATVYAELGETDQAFAWLEQADTVLPWGFGLYVPHPGLDPLRSEPRFVAMAAEAGRDPWGRLLP